MKFFYLLLIFLPAFAFAEAKHYRIGCQVYDLNLTLLHDYGGSRCLFNEDGSYVRSGPKNDIFEKISPLGEIIWRRKISTHHHMSISIDKKRLLVVADDLHKEDWCNVRYDKLLILDHKTGKTLYEWSLFKNRRDFFKNYSYRLFHWLPPSYKLGGSDTDLGEHKACEFTHFNAIYEIPENAASEKVPALQPGNIISTAQGHGFFVFTKDLKKIIWRLELPESKGALVLSALALPDGDILFSQKYQSGYQIRLHHLIDRSTTTLATLTDHSLKIYTYELNGVTYQLPVSN